VLYQSFLKTLLLICWPIPHTADCQCNSRMFCGYHTAWGGSQPDFFFWKYFMSHNGPSNCSRVYTQWCHVAAHMETDCTSQEVRWDGWRVAWIPCVVELFLFCI
jgi:hypothetical protein